MDKLELVHKFVSTLREDAFRKNLEVIGSIEYSSNKTEDNIIQLSELGNLFVKDVGIQKHYQHAYSKDGAYFGLSCRRIFEVDGLSIFMLTTPIMVFEINERVLEEGIFDTLFSKLTDACDLYFKRVDVERYVKQNKDEWNGEVIKQHYGIYPNAEVVQSIESAIEYAEKELGFRFVPERSTHIGSVLGTINEPNDKTIPCHMSISWRE